MHGLLSNPQWGWHCGGLPVATHRWWMWNLPPTHWRRKPYPWVRKSSHQRLQVSPQNAKKFLSMWNPLSKLMLLAPLLLHPPCPNLAASSQKTRKSWWGVEADLSHTGECICSYMQKSERVSKWRREFWSLMCSKDECFGDIEVKGLACWQATTFRLPAT